MGSGSGPVIERLEVGAYEVPTETPESDGTLEWSSTTAVVVEAHGGGCTGTGYTYMHAAAARLITDVLAPVVRGRPALDVSAAWWAMVRAVRNIGRAGVAAGAISAVDTALWDLKARVLELPLVSLFGAVRAEVPVYGSGGFTSEPVELTVERLGAWVARGFGRVKMKVGRHPERDDARVRAVREAIGGGVELFVDANGAYDVARAAAWAERFAARDVVYLEEPVVSTDPEGLRRVRDFAPPGLAIAAGEYAYSIGDLRRLLEAGAVDVLQADATRCGGFTAMLGAGALCEAWTVPLSTHTAQTLHTHVACAIEPVVHVEYFFDHARVERLLFDGVPEPEGGVLRPDLSAHGMGIRLKRKDAADYAR